MPTPAAKLAQSLEVLSGLQRSKGAAAIRARDLSRTHRQRLLRTGFLQEVIKGWLISSRPDEMQGESTAWYASFWRFCAAYLEERFGPDWCLSPEQSLSLHAGNWTVPRQLLVRSPLARNKVTNLPYRTSLLDLRAVLPPKGDREIKEGMRIFSLESALIACAPARFSRAETDIRASLASIRNASGLLARLLEGGHSTIAGRLAGAFRNGGHDRVADDIIKTMSAAGYTTRESDPFTDPSPVVLSRREASPHVNRLRLLWAKMREPVIGRFPEAPGLPRAAGAYMRRVDEAYLNDAYHSLSIEGYEVSRSLIERVRTNAWNPERHEEDRNRRNALAASGYWKAHQEVRKSVVRVLGGENPGLVADEEHGTWYRELFGPGVTAGLLRQSDLAGYRNGQVYIRGSLHVPLKREALLDAMPALFDLLRGEPDASARAVLGHFVFVYIHPYMDGNGRVGRFLMNLMLASGGYPWTVVPVEERRTYMAALEKASVEGDVVPFADFLSGLVKKRLAGEPLPSIPKDGRD